MDSVLDYKQIPILKSTLTDSNVRQSVRLLCVFGCNGEEVIFATNEDKVYGFGRNRFGGLGLGTVDDGIKVPQLNVVLSGKQVIDIVGGYEHWIALTVDHQCYAWGHNQFGQLGIGSIESTSTTTPQLINSFSGGQIASLSCGATHSLALTSDGQVVPPLLEYGSNYLSLQVYCWGSNKSGQLGNGSKGFIPRPQLMSFKEDVLTICCGKNHSIALTVSGQVYVWGINNYGQLGLKLNDTFIAYYPKLITGLESIDFSKAICGPNYSLLLSQEGYVYAFGENSCGQVGTGSSDNQLMPSIVSEDILFKDIIAHKENDVSIGVSTDDKYYVWGLANNRRYMKPKEMTDSTSRSAFDVYAKYAKTKVTYKTIVVNEVLNSCKTMNKKVIQRNQPKILNVCPPKSAKKQNNCKVLKTLDDVVDVKSYPIVYATICDQRMRDSIRLLRVFGVKGCKVIFATNADNVYGFGLNRDGSLGLGSFEIKVRKPLLNPVLSGKQLIDIAPGFEHCLGLTANGLIYAWGQNSYGELGIGNTKNQSIPQLVEDLADLKVVQIKCGAYFSMALTSDGELFSWGHNTFAQLGDRTYNSREVPTQVFINEKVVSLSCGTNHTIALTESKRVYLWGNNTVGQLGRHPDLDVQKSREKPMSNRPRILEGFQNVQKAVCGQNNNLVLTTDGQLYSFGGNACGQIGNGTLKDQFTPFRLNDNNKIKIKDIVSNFDIDFSCAVSEDNRCYVWGYVQYKNILRPKLLPESWDRLFDIYGIYSANKTMFETLIVNTLEQISASGLQFDETQEVFQNNEEFYLFPPNFYDFSTEELKITREMIDSEEVKSLDEELNLNLFPVLNTTLTDENMRKRIRLLHVFGKSGSNVLFATTEDKVYAFGNNNNGCLGLGTYEQNIRRPTLNETLSNTELIDISNGFEHCLGLTAKGRCYSWGTNKYGQLGLGYEKPAVIPKLIEARVLKDKKVIQIGCGAYHSLLLTIDGQIFSWGMNMLGQLGTSNYWNYPTPILIEVKHPIVSISCGLNHSSAVDNIGMSYAWGHNKFGQLGREREGDYRPERKEWIGNRPSSNLYFKNITFIKSICGPNYTLFLTIDGYVYAFGDNTNGQVGNGEGGRHQFRPIRINEDIRFKDVVSHKDNDLSVGVSTDNRYYVWGLACNERVLSPKLVTDVYEDSIFNVYGKYATKKITFKTIIFNQKKIMNELVINSSPKDIDLTVIQVCSSNEEEDSPEDYYKSNLNRSNSELSLVNDSLSNQSSVQSSKPSMAFQSHLNQSFNNPNNSDLKIISENRIIYCHKTILQIRNQKFWQILCQKISEDKSGVRINGEKFDVFYAFIQYLYGIKVELNDQIIADLKAMAQHFDESDLLDDCSEYIRDMTVIPDLVTVCPLYEKAINEGLPDLEKSCIQFASSNWKAVINSDQFLAMDDSLSKRLMVSALSLE